MNTFFKTTTEFGIAADSAPSPSLFAVIGRCFKGTIRPGTRFDLRFRYLRADPKDFATPPESRDEELVDLVVERVEMYDRAVEFVDSGCTARVWLRAGKVPARPFTDGDVIAESVK